MASMELREIKEITSEIIELVSESANGLIFRKYDTFLAQFGMENRRDFEILKKVDRQFSKHHIKLWCGKAERTSVIDFVRGERITFRMGDIKDSDSGIAGDGSRRVNSPHAGTIGISQEASGIDLYQHQRDAIQQLNEKILRSGRNPFSGILVLPTGGGKTLTAAYWLCKNLLNNNKKVLWVAHRHELLEQAKSTFHERLAFRDIMPSRTSFNYRLISGVHDKPVHIRPTDDIIISSKDSLNAGFDYLLEKWIKGNTDEVFLVIDEAHHATAKTYRRLMENLKKNVKRFSLLGLTATPFRTAEAEQGHLGNVFPDDIVYKIDLRTLITRGILSKPIFEEVKTHIDFTHEFSDRQLETIQRLDLTALDEATINSIAENKERNLAIVSAYLRKREKYKQTLVFALNQSNAIALNALFKQGDVRSDYVLSGIRDNMTGVTRSPKENKEKIDRFRRGELDVLINVNILTEGTDVPKVQSVFLTRPTISRILMTQMIGRGLRGELAGGTKESYIVSFIDDWKEKIEWVNPERLLIEENVDFSDQDKETRKQLLRLISINKIEEFALLADNLIDATTKSGLENLDFIERVPVGIYHFSDLRQVEGEEPQERSYEILVYDNIRDSYNDFVNALPDFFKRHRLLEVDTLSDGQLETLCADVEKDYFHGCEKYPGYRPDDIKDILQYYAQNEEPPRFIGLKEREKYDLTKVARDILDRGMTRPEEREYKAALWSGGQGEWKAFFGHRNEQYFLSEIDLAIRREEHPHLYKRPDVVPTDTKELKRLEELSMADLREHNPRYWKQMSEAVHNKFRDADGYYFSAQSGFKSKDKIQFQIDHIHPMSAGGLTRLDNLQLLTRSENAQKGSRVNRRKIVPRPPKRR